MNEPQRTPIPRLPGTTRYTWFVGVALFLAVAYFTLNTLTTKHASSTGPKVGRRMPPFAMPLALSALNGDANVATRPHQGGAGSRPACTVRGPEILNICQLWERGPVALAFLATRGGSCEEQLDRLQAVRGEFPTVQIAAVAIRGDRGDLRRDVRAHGWQFPVGYDHDGVVSSLYGVAVCPQITLADRGGRVRKTLIGEVSAARLRRELGALARRDR